jgi:hypothetical protein
MNQPPLVSIAHFWKSRFEIEPMKNTTRIAREAMQITTVKRKVASTPT